MDFARGRSKSASLKSYRQCGKKTRGARTQGTQSLMRIIADKTPGKLIIVMAGARGIQGRDMTIMTPVFAIRKGLAGNPTTVFEAPEVQVMGNDLKEIECKVNPGTFLILQ